MQIKLSNVRWGIYALAMAMLATSATYIACSTVNIPTSPPITSIMPPTVSLSPTQTPYPTSTPYPTIVIIPSPTRAIPTSTPYPTATSVPPTATPRPIPTSTPPLPTPTVSSSLAGLIALIRPAVVLIGTERGNGSGVIFQTDKTQNSALVLTNYHVIEDAGSIYVLVNDDKRYEGNILGIDPVRDLAVLEICCDSTFDSLELGDESNITAGDDVISMGYTLGNIENGAATVTKGIVSSKRYWQALDRWEIQTDITVDPTSSGGPLLSMSGDILGLNTWVLRQYNSGLDLEDFGFAVSVESIREQMPDLMLDSTDIDISPPTRLSSSYGPIDGNIKHDPDCKCIRTFNTGVAVSDAIVQATFFNPYSASAAGHGYHVGHWDYGFIFRSSNVTNDKFHSLIIRSDGGWYHVLRMGNVESYLIDGGKSKFINTKYGQHNLVQIMMIDDEGWLFVNNRFVATLNLNEIVEAGRLMAFAGYSPGDSVKGFSTMFEGLSISPIDPMYHLASHSLVHELEYGQSESIDARVGLSNGLIKVSLSNPYSIAIGSWDYGIMLTDSEQSYPMYSLTVDSEGIWRYLMHTDEGYQILSISPATSLNTVKDMTNNLAVTILGHRGWFFVNGGLLSGFDIDASFGPINVLVVTDLFDDNEISGEYTDLSDFGIWGTK